MKFFLGWLEATKIRGFADLIHRKRFYWNLIRTYRVCFLQTEYNLFIWTCTATAAIRLLVTGDRSIATSPGDSRECSTNLLRSPAIRICPRSYWRWPIWMDFELVWPIWPPFVLIFIAVPKSGRLLCGRNSSGESLNLISEFYLWIESKTMYTEIDLCHRVYGILQCAE